MSRVFVLFVGLLAVVAGLNIDAPISTGQNLGVGSHDPNWSATFASVTGQTVVAKNNGFWKDFSSFSTWISPEVNAGQSGNFTYATSFNLVKYDPAHYFLNADISSDDELIGITINNVKVPLVKPACASTLEFYKCTASYKFSEHFKSGQNDVEFLVNNLGGVENPTGLNVNFYI